MFCPRPAHLFTVLLLALIGSKAIAQAYPSRPIRLIVPQGPGGGLDYIARSVVARLTDILSQAIVVDNRPGAGGDIGIKTAADAIHDGYTLLMVSAVYLVRPSMYKVPYDPFRDFAAVSQVAAAPYLLVVHAPLPAKSVSELIAYAKSNPGKLNYASSGNGGLVHLTGELFKVSSGIDLVHVPYKSFSTVFADLISGQVQLTFPAIPSALPLVRSQRLRALAVTSAQRVKVMPELPTMIESGVTGFEVKQWHGLLAPAGTPRPIVERLSGGIVTVLQQPEVIARLTRDGAEAVGSSPQQFTAKIKTEYEKWARVIKEAGIRGD